MHFPQDHPPLRPQKPEKLPPVDTLTSRQIREVSKVLPATSKTKLNQGSGPGFKPMQPKVAAHPHPFHGVHKQDSIIESPQVNATFPKLCPIKE